MRVGGLQQWYLGLSVWGSTVRGVLVRGGGNRAAVESTFETDLAEVESPNAFRAYLKKVAPGAKPQSLQTALLLDGVPFALESKSFPAAKPEDFTKAATWYAQNNRRTDCLNPTYAAWPRRREDDNSGIEGLLVETDGDQVGMLLGVAGKLGLRKAQVVPTPFSYQAILRRHMGRDETTALVFATGDGEGTISAFLEGEVYLHRAVDLTRDPFDFSLDDLALDSEEDRSGGGGAGTATSTAVEATISESKLVTEMERTCHYLQSRFHVSPESIYLGGEGETVAAAVAKSTSLQVGNLRPESESGEEWNLNFLAAYGAALHIGQESHVGILPQRETRKAGSGRQWPVERIRRGAVRGGVFTLALFLSALALQKVVQKENDSVTERHQMIVEENSFPEQEAMLSEWEMQALALNSFRSSQHLWSEAFSAVGATVPEGIVVTTMTGAVPKNQDVDLEELDPLIDDPLAEVMDEEIDDMYYEEDEDSPWMEIHGNSPHISPVRQFVLNLEQRIEFEQVIIAEAAIDPEDPGAGYEFTLRCKPAVDRRFLVPRTNGGDPQ